MMHCQKNIKLLRNLQSGTELRTSGRVMTLRFNVSWETTRGFFFNCQH